MTLTTRQQLERAARDAERRAAYDERMRRGEITPRRRYQLDPQAEAGRYDRMAAYRDAIQVRKLGTRDFPRKRTKAATPRLRARNARRHPNRRVLP